MQGVYLPAFHENTSWPDSIRNDFTAQLHKFMGGLTDARWKLADKTVLYIPREANALSEHTMFGEKINKDLIQRQERQYLFIKKIAVSNNNLLICC